MRSTLEGRAGLLALLLLFLTAFAVRVLSLQWSLLPYNIDGLSEVRVSQDIILSGHLDFSPDSSQYESYVADMPLLGLLVAFVSSALGTNALTTMQPTTALLGSVAVLLLILIFSRHWRSVRGLLAAGVVLALTGSFVFSAGCSWKESLGFVLLALILYAFPLRRCLEYRVLLTVCLPLLVFTHHHVTVVTFVILTFAMVLELARRVPARAPPTRHELADAMTVILAWSLAASYYALVGLPYLDDLSPSTDLYLYVAVASLLLMIGVRASRRDRPLTSLPVGLAVLAAGALLMLYNYYDPIFPGIPGPAGLIAIPVLAYLILAAPAWEGARLALAPRGKTKDLLLAMLLGPLSLILFAFLRGLDPTSHLVIYRTFDFLMVPFALLIGVGFAYIVKGRERLGIVAGVSLVIVCTATLPVAYQTQELFGVENQTYWFEYDAVEWFSEHGVDAYTSDQRLGETGWRLFDLDYGRGLPYDLREGIALNKSAFFVLEADWNSSGAQEFPFGVVVVESSKIASVLNESSVFYVGGPLGGQIVGFRTR